MEVSAGLAASSRCRPTFAIPRLPYQMATILRRSRSTPSFETESRGVNARPARAFSNIRPPAAMILEASSEKSSPEAAILLSKKRQAAKRGEATQKPVVRRQDFGYPGNANDKLLLRLPAKTRLGPRDVVDILQFPRNLNERYEIKDMIGMGSFGEVYRAIDRDTGEAYACKSIPKVPKGEAFTSPHYLLKIRSEIDIMSHLGSSLDAVFLVGGYEDDTHIHVVMELCDGGTLMEKMTAIDSTEDDVALVMRSIFRFLALCHSRDVVYRDVKPENFLFTTNDHSHTLNLKATDFGLAIRHPEGSPPLTLAAGTPIYVAPEVFARCYGKPADIYSAGVLAFHLLTGRYPYWPNMSFPSPSLQQLQDIILHNDIDFSMLKSEGVSESAQEFLKMVLVKDPSLRITAAEALHHPWIRDNTEGMTEDTIPLEGTTVQRLQRFAVYSHLKQKVLAMIVSDMVAAEDDEILAQVDASDLIEPLRCIFRLMNPSQQGSATIGDIVAELEREGYCLSDAETHQILESLDTDNDGSVTFSEFAAPLLDWDKVVCSERWEGLVRRAFARLDLDQDGSLDIDDLIESFQSTKASKKIETDYEAPATERRESASAMIRDFDVNYDGQISWEEFYQCLSQDNTMKDLECFDKRQFSSNSLTSASALWESGSSASIDDGQKLITVDSQQECDEPSA